MDKLVYSASIATIYPAPISRAISLLDEVPEFREMPDGFIRVVIRLVKKICLSNPSQPIFASRASLATESGKSVETIHRVIRWLEAEGLIERHQISRSNQRGSQSLITPTTRFLRALGLLDGPQTGKPAETARAPKKLSDFKTAAQKSLQSLKNGLFVRISGIAIPEDLAWLVERGITSAGVLKLMGIATRNAKRLSVVVEATRQYLENLSGNKLFSYIKALLMKDCDFGRSVQDRMEMIEKVNTEAVIQYKAEIFEGRSFVNPETGTHYSIADGVIRVTRKDGTTGVGNLTEKFIESLEAGRVREVRG